MGTLTSLVSGTEWSHFTDYLSPSFFDVVRGRELRRVLGTLSGNYMRGRRFRDAKEARATYLADADVPVRLGDASSATLGDRRDGDALLELYFHQLYYGPTTILDLRHDRFVREGDSMLWKPAALYIEWDSDFLSALRELYRGFYSGDDHMFEAALAELNLVPAKDIFLEHFGSGDQDAVAFDMKTFHDTFHRAFVACREQGSQLHGDFIALGLYLATLYEHLEAVGGEWDVRAAWRRAAPGVSSAAKGAAARSAGA